MALLRLSKCLLADLGLGPVGAAYDILSLPVELQQQIFLHLSAVAHFRCTSVCTAKQHCAHFFCGRRRCVRLGGYCRSGK